MKQVVKDILEIANNTSYTDKQKEIRIEIVLIHFESNAKINTIEALSLK